MVSEEQPTLEQGGEPEGVAGPLKEIDPETLKKLTEKIKALKEGEKIDGSPETLNLDKYEIEPDMVHLYKRATLETTPEGAKVWAVVMHEYYIQTGPWHMDGGGQQVPVGNRGKTRTRSEGLDQIMTRIVNGPEGMLSAQRGWKVSALVPLFGLSGHGAVVFEREVKRILDDPKPITDPEATPLEKADDAELAKVQEAAQKWEASTEKPE